MGQMFFCFCREKTKKPQKESDEDSNLRQKVAKGLFGAGSRMKQRGPLICLSGIGEGQLLFFFVDKGLAALG